jgi:uncharacterized membrane protein
VWRTLVGSASHRFRFAAAARGVSWARTAPARRAGLLLVLLLLIIVLLVLVVVFAVQAHGHAAGAAPR